jgi:hypothetical protein
MPLAIAAGVLSALFFAPLMSQSVMALFVSPFSMLPLFMVGLGLGVGMTTLASVSATIAIGAMGGLIGAGMYAISEAIPAIILSHQALSRRQAPGGARYWTPPGQLMQIAVIYACLLLVIPIIVFAGHDGGVRALIEDQLVTNVVTISGGKPDLQVQESVRQFAHRIAYWAPVSFSITWLVLTIANLWIGQWLLIKWKRNLRPSLGLRSLEVPRWNMILLGLALLLWILGSGDVSFTGVSLALILAMPYTFVGIVIIHMLARNWGPGPFVVVGFYVVLAFARWPAALPAAALGFAEQWVKLRQKIGGPTPS